MDDENDKQESAHTPVRANGDSRGNRRLSFAGSQLQPLRRDEQISAAGILIAKVSAGVSGQGVIPDTPFVIN